MIASTIPKLSHIYLFGADSPPVDADEKILGGKGHSLALMSKAGLPVPPGFTISTECCRIYNKDKRWADGLESELKQALAWLEAATGFTFGTAPKPLLVAVRSGAAVSMPGMMDTVLNCGLHPGLEKFVPNFWETYRDFIKHYGEIVSGIGEKAFEEALHCSTDPKIQAEKSLLAYKAAAKREFPTDPYIMMKEAVNAVFESWNSERAARYRQKNNVRNVAGTAVNVQSMCPSELSGVLFTQDPNNPAANTIIIEGTTGLGEALVLGRVEPDLFVLDRGSLAVKDKRMSESHESDAHLSETQVNDLAKLGMKVEEYFHFPVDIEWGWANGRFSLLQSRRIRGLDVALDVPLAREDEINRLKALANGTPKAWVMHNLGETLSFPTPLTWDIVGDFMNRGGFIDLYRDLGFVPSARVQKEGFLELVAGRIYADANGAAELFFDTFPLEYDLALASPEQLLGPPTKFNYERAGAGFLFKLPLFLYRMLKSSKLMKRLAQSCLQDFEHKTLPVFLDFAKNAHDKNLGAMNDTELLKELAHRERVGLNNFGRETLKPGFLASYFHDRLTKDFEQIFGPEKGPELMSKLLRGLDGDRTVESNIALYRVAHGDLSMERYLSEYGHRAINEFEMSEKRYKEDHSYLLTIINNYKRMANATPVIKTESGAPSECATPGELHDRQKTERSAAEDLLSRQLAEHGAASLEKDVRENLLGAQRYLPYRETGKHYFMMAVALVREVLEEFAERHDLGKDMYFLHRSELAELASRKEELKKLIAQRKVRWQSLQRLDLPEVLHSGNLEALGRHEEAAVAKDGVMTGLGVAAGVGTGTARLVKSPTEAGDLGAGYVLVCPTTDPSWAPLFVHARGLVVERGGMLSHGAIVARDFGIPAVVMKNASRMIPDGSTIKVDGSKGRVEVLSVAST